MPRSSTTCGAAKRSIAPLLRRLYREIERLYLNSVDALLYNSETTRHTVEPLLDRKRPALVAYPAADHLPADEPAVDLNTIAARSRAPGPLRILFVGNLIPRKGLDQVLDALAKLPPGFLAADSRWESRC